MLKYMEDIGYSGIYVYIYNILYNLEYMCIYYILITRYDIYIYICMGFHIGVSPILGTSIC